MDLGIEFITRPKYLHGFNYDNAPMMLIHDQKSTNILNFQSFKLKLNEHGVFLEYTRGLIKF